MISQCQYKTIGQCESRCTFCSECTPKLSISRTAQVHSKLILQGMTSTDLAKRAEVSQRMVFYVLKGQRTSRRVQKVVAEVLEIGFEELWGKGFAGGDAGATKNKE